MKLFQKLAAIMAGLCIRSGNGLVLKGGNEASQTNQAILEALHSALEDQGLSQDCILSLTGLNRENAAWSMLLQANGVDLIIPYGRPNLVKQVVRQGNGARASDYYGQLLPLLVSYGLSRYGDSNGA